MMSNRPRLRPAVRAVVTDEDRRVLLVHFRFPWEDDLPDGFWACPGGGVDPGEPMSAALARELREELGLEVEQAGTPIWRKEHVFAMERWDGQHDTYFWVEVEAFDPKPQLTQQQLLDENVDEVRWWSYDELLTAQRAFDTGDRDDPAYTVLSPRRLGHLVSDLLSAGRPAQPVELDPL